MPVPNRLLLSCVVVSAATLFLVQRQQRIVQVATAYTRGTSVKYFGTYPSLPLSSDGDSRPPLSSLVGDNDEEIKQDVQFLMDFAIIGHPKTATTTTLRWLGSHNETQVFPEELHALQMGKPAEHVRVMYNLPAGNQYKRGYKAPRDIGNAKVLRSISEYWPKTKLIIGLRHPVSWLQSFYNFRVRHGFKMPPPETLIGRCGREANSVCTDEALFHVHLSNLGKTNMSSVEERKLLAAPDYKVLKNLPRLSNPVFLYEINQMHDEDKAREALYRSDLENYLGLREPLEPLDGSHTRNKTNVFDICDGKYDDLRHELMKHAKSASIWIRKYLLPHPDVVVSSKDHFEELLIQWMTDPCLLRP